ncbi:conserved protein of unknown function [Tenacibaculum sp. 190524A02b]|uniref:hypothetical protein n=1 Tax=Tenacibaculum vairaonense TaxID=3137860 RepID=UPI0032B2E514
MTLKKLKKEIEKKGYKSFLRKNDNEEWIMSGIHDSETNLKFGSAFQIRILENKMLLSYLTGQSLVNVSFSSLSKLFEYIENKFPIE